LPPKFRSSKSPKWMCKRERHISLERTTSQSYWLIFHTFTTSFSRCRYSYSAKRPPSSWTLPRPEALIRPLILKLTLPKKSAHEVLRRAAVAVVATARNHGGPRNRALSFDPSQGQVKRIKSKTCGRSSGVMPLMKMTVKHHSFGTWGAKLYVFVSYMKILETYHFLSCICFFISGLSHSCGPSLFDCLRVHWGEYLAVIAKIDD